MYTTSVEETKRIYNYIRQLITTNRNDNKVTIDFSKLDGETKEKLKQAIAITIDNCKSDESYIIKEEDYKAINELLKQNTSSTLVTIDYEKLEPYQVKFSIKGAVHEVLKTRSGKIYKNLLLRSGN